MHSRSLIIFLISLANSFGVGKSEFITYHSSVELKTFVQLQQDNKVHVVLKVMNNVDFNSQKLSFDDGMSKRMDIINSIAKPINEAAYFTFLVYLLLRLLCVCIGGYFACRHYKCKYIKLVRAESSLETLVNDVIPAVSESVLTPTNHQLVTHSTSNDLLFEVMQSQQQQIQIQLIQQQEEQKKKYDQTIERCRMVIEDLMSHEMRQQHIDEEFHISLQEAISLSPTSTAIAPEYSYDEIHAKLFSHKHISTSSVHEHDEIIAQLAEDSTAPWEPTNLLLSFVVLIVGCVLLTLLLLLLLVILLELQQNKMNNFTKCADCIRMDALTRM